MLLLQVVGYVMRPKLFKTEWRSVTVGFAGIRFDHPLNSTCATDQSGVAERTVRVVVAADAPTLLEW